MPLPSLLAIALTLSLSPSTTGSLPPATTRPSTPSAPKADIFQIKIYSLKTAAQEERLDQFLQQAYLPALHRQGVRRVGVFKAAGNDTAAIRRVYILTSYHSLADWKASTAKLEKDPQFRADGKDHLEAPYTDVPYLRQESILLEAFPGMTFLDTASLTGPKTQRVYELRSYEGPTERYFASKVQMFNKGDEIGLFKKLGFNAIFYASVISGAHMPNLMYMTSFNDMASREEHWKAFFSDPQWKELTADPQYQHNVSHVDITFLHPAEYSDL